MNYHNKKFRPVSNSENGVVSSEMIFHYKQQENILTCNYHGIEIKEGHLIGIVDEHGAIDMRYHQINQNNEIMTGICHSKPTLNESGKIILNEFWQWTSGDHSKGQSILEEI